MKLASAPDIAPAPVRPHDRRRGGLLLGALGALLPGLGHYLAGHRRTALLWTLPHLVMIGVLVGLLQAGRNALYLALNERFLLVAAVALLLVAIWRMLAGFSAMRLGRPLGFARAPALLLILLLGGAAPLYGAYTAFEVRDGLGSIFGGDLASGFYDGTAGLPDPGASAAPTPAPTPIATDWDHWNDDGILTLLLVGGDAGPGRWSRRTDTMIMVQVDSLTGKAAMIGLPRNLNRVPLPPESAAASSDGTLHDLLNALYTYAEARPQHFPGPDGLRGYYALEHTIENLTGVAIDGMLVVDLQGVVRMVDALGGLTINVTETVDDQHLPDPDGGLNKPFHLDKGLQTLDGYHFLGYIRSRHQDSDYGRMRRQQSALLAVRAALDPLELLPRVGELVAAAKGAFWSNLPSDALAKIAQLADSVNTKTVTRIYLTPYYKIPEYLDEAAIKTIRSRIAAALK